MVIPMKTRVLVAVIAIPLLVVVIFFLPSLVLGCVVGACAALAAWEFLGAMSVNLMRMKIYAAVFAFIIPVASVYSVENAITQAAFFLLLAICFGELTFSFMGEEPMPVDDAAMTLVGGGLFPYLLASIVRLGYFDAPVYILLVFIAAFSSDTASYFAGSLLGRHSLAPRVSPNKTIEGSIGGFAGSIGVMLIYGFILKSAGFTVNFPVIAIYGFLGSLIAQLGDLGFSAIKRIAGVKDYGTLLPGHGGMLDRLDSIILVAPLMEILMRWVPAFWK